MHRSVKAVSKKAGLPPGTLVYVGKRGEERVKVDIIDYTDFKLQEKTVKKVEECFPFKNKPTVTWLNITGIHQIDIIEKIGKYFGIHSLVLEDIVNANQRSKIEDFENHLFLVLRMIYYDKDSGDIKSEQISLILGKHFVISFQETEGDVFDPIRDRIRKKKGKIRKMGSDYLAYTLIDAIVDNYFLILEKIGEKIESLEETVVGSPDPKTLDVIHKLKGDLIHIRKSVWPLREIINNMLRGESKLIKKSTAIYLRDIYDHTIQVIDNVETFKEMVSGMVDIYLSSISNRMNEIMKVLTIFAAIFIPLTFVAGVYGMNFEFMPELRWRYGYLFAWLVILLVGGSMLAYFNRKKWI
ncbi:magnesium/cobalt transporter CorA [Candidatus Woesearchaeota archaeon]|nr:magnesium/cobalt transporter CorA [Candidatus Woesearchaeota archaeon]